MRRRRLYVVLLLAVAAAVLVVVWRSTDVKTTGSETPADARPSNLGRSPELALAQHEVGGSSASPPATRPDRWWYSGKVQSIRPEVVKARVVAHWWPRPGMTAERPTRVYTSEELDLARGPASFRVEGDAAGFVILYLEAEGRLQLFMPWRTPQGDAVEPSFGRGAGVGYVGTYELRARAVDKRGAGVPDVRLQVRDTNADLVQEVMTGSDGHFRLDGFRTRSLTVTMPEAGGWGTPGEFAGFRDRPILLGDEDVEVVIPRNPVVVPRLGAWIGGTFFPAAANQFQITKLLRDGRTQAWATTYLHGREQRLRLTSGAWRLVHTTYGALSPPVETGTLELDGVVQLEIPASWDSEVPLVGVEFDASPHPGEQPLRCAAELRNLDIQFGWQGARSYASGDRVLLTCTAGRFGLAGAIGRGDEVFMSSPEQITLVAGDRKVARLLTRRAGGIHVPPAPRQYSHATRLRLREHAFPSSGIVEGNTFKMAWLGYTDRATTWWMLPGDYVLQSTTGRDRVLDELTVVVDAAQVAHVEEGDGGLRRVP